MDVNNPPPPKQEIAQISCYGLNKSMKNTIKNVVQQTMKVKPKLNLICNNNNYLLSIKSYYFY